MNALIRPQFYVDVEEEVAWLAEKADVEVARRWHEAVWQTLETLKFQPEMGRLRKDLKMSGIRSWRVNHFTRWLIFYEVHPSKIIFYRVRSGLMNLLVLQLES